MIDEKKIEEVASKDSAFLYSEWNTPCREAYVRGFKACMHWLRQNLWHDASDVPEDGTPLLFLFRNSDGYEGYGVLEYVVQSCGLTYKAHFNSFCFIHTITHKFRGWVGKYECVATYSETTSTIHPICRDIALSCGFATKSNTSFLHSSNLSVCLRMSEYG